MPDTDLRLRRPCVACGNDDPTRVTGLYRLSTYDVICCRVCGCIYVNRPDMNTVGGEVIYAVENATVHAEHRVTLFRVAEKHYAVLSRKISLGPETRLLDFGCGNGYFLKVASDHGISAAYGLEVNRAAAEYAQGHFGVNVVADAPPYPSIAGQLFDIITLWGVIEHLPQPKAVLDLLRQHMHAQSVLVMQTPTEDAFIRQITHRLNRLSHQQMFVPEMYQEEIGRHTQCFDRRSMAVLLNRVGLQVFEVEDSTYGFNYMTKHLNSRSPIALAKKLAMFAAYGASSVFGHQNHMVVYARPTGVAFP